MIVKKIFSSILNIHFIILFFIFLISSRRQKKYVLVFISITYFFSTPLGSNLAIFPLEKDYLHCYFLYYSILDNPRNIISMYEKIDKIIILGGGIKGNRELGEESLSRTILASLIYINLKRYYNRTPEIIILGGNIQNPNNSTSLSMKLLIKNLNYDTKIIIEKESKDTHQNIMKLREFLKPTDKAIVITSASHLKRTKTTFHHTFNKEFIENNLIFIPVNFRYEYITSFSPYLFLPNIENLETTNIALYEIIGNLYYQLFYQYKKLLRR